MKFIRKFGIIVLLLWTLVVTLLRALYPPNEFAEAHWIIDYRFGFIKRGFIGTLVSLFTEVLHIHLTEQLIIALSGIAFIVFCLVLIVLGLRIIHRSSESSTAILVVLVFLSSPFIVMSAQLTGYFDNLVIMLAVASIMLLLNNHIWIAVCLQSTALLIHEEALLISLPVFLLTWLLINRQKRTSNNASLPFLPLLLPFFTFIVLTICQSYFISPNFTQNLSERLSEFPFIHEHRRKFVPIWLTTTFFDYYKSQSVAFADRLSSPQMLSLIVPPVLIMIFFLFYTHKIRKISFTAISLLIVCIIPQIMHMVAWDTTRIWTYSIICTFLVLWAYTEVSVVQQEISLIISVLSLAGLVGNAIMLTPLMDAYNEHFSLATRLLLYTPTFVIAVALIVDDAIKLFRAKSATNRHAALSHTHSGGAQDY